MNLLTFAAVGRPRRGLVAVAAVIAMNMVAPFVAAQEVATTRPVTTAPTEATATPVIPPAPVAKARPAAPVPVENSPRPHVLIVSIDGLRPDCLLRADAPTLRGLMAAGSFSLWATTTDVAITTPSHVSMLTGVTPERHRIDFNGDPPDGARIAVPTLFDLAKRAGLSTALSSGKRKFDLFTFTDSIDHVWLTTETSLKDQFRVSDEAATIVREHRPDVMVVHFPGSDIVGHAIGWGTPQQLEMIGRIDQALGRVIDAYRTAGLLETTTIIISSDHGGTVRSHGKDDLRSRFIPWICVGPNVRKNYDLTRLGKTYEVRTYDTFATACHILNLPADTGVDGKPILPIFENFDLMQPVSAPKAAAKAE